MDLEPTLGPKTSDQDRAEETQRFDCDAIDTPKAAAIAQVDRCAAGKREGALPTGVGELNGAGAKAIIEPRMSSVAGTICGDRGSLCQAVVGSR
jgi:hypothetical protein